MRKFFFERLNVESLFSGALLIISESAIGLCYALATILGVLGAQRYAAPDYPIPENIVSGIFIGTAIWAALTGISIRNDGRNKFITAKRRLPTGWILISFLTCTAVPILYVLKINGAWIPTQWVLIFQTCLFSALSFGLGGVIIALPAILLHFFYWRFLASVKWGIIVACAIGLLLGLSVGWAAYGWTVFSSQALFSLSIYH